MSERKIAGTLISNTLNMKRNLMFIIFVVFTSSILAEDFDILELNFQPWGNTKFDVQTMKITWTNEWEGGGWWLSRDCSEYDLIKIEFKEPLEMDVVITIIYSAKDEKNENLKYKKTIYAGEKKKTIVLDPTYKISVDGLGISGSKAGSVVLQSFLLKKYSVES